MNKLTLLATALVLTGCASSPNKISALYTSDTPYMRMNCHELVIENNRIRLEVNKLYKEVKKDSNRDNVAMAVGMLVFWPALFFVGGDSPDANTYAVLKGKAEAVERAMASSQCEFTRNQI